MNSRTAYRQVFQLLKGMALPGLDRFVLPIPYTGFCLQPVKCHPDRIDIAIVKLLTNARNANASAFLTTFHASTQRTWNWIAGQVASDASRILFVVRQQAAGDIYGYMGLAYGNDEGTYIEADAIVRTSHNPIRSLMRRGFETMTTWVTDELGIDDVWVRVLSDNPAVAFYQKSGFVVEKVEPLFESYQEDGRAKVLSVSPLGTEERQSGRTLTYMRRNSRTAL